MLPSSAPRIISTLCLLVAFLLPPSAASAQSAAEVQKIAEQVIRRLDLQTKLPTEPEPPRPAPLSLPPEALWVVIALALGVLIYAFSEMLPFRRKGLRGDWSSNEAAPGDTTSRPPEVVLGAADELARGGRYVEAMHVLLLQGLADIRRHLGEHFADSLTSREILRHTRLSAAGRAALADIVERVEWTHFGQRPAAETDYQACRASFGALAQALHAGAGAESQPA
jgi:hypothetical protein